MTKTAIRNLHSDKPIPPRFCDVVIEDGKIFLEKKTDKKQFEKIPWEETTANCPESLYRGAKAGVIYQAFYGQSR